MKLLSGLRNSILRGFRKVLNLVEPEVGKTPQKEPQESEELVKWVAHKDERVRSYPIMSDYYEIVTERPGEGMTIYRRVVSAKGRKINREAHARNKSQARNWKKWRRRRWR